MAQNVQGAILKV